VWLNRREIESKFLKFLLVLVVVTQNNLRVEGLIMFASIGLSSSVATLELV